MSCWVKTFILSFDFIICIFFSTWISRYSSTMVRSDVPSGCCPTFIDGVAAFLIVICSSFPVTSLFEIISLLKLDF